MELEELSEMLTGQTTPGERIGHLFTHPAQQPVTVLLKKNIMFEIICLIVFIVAAIAALIFHTNRTLQLFSGVIIAGSVVFGLVLLRLHRQITHYETNTCDTAAAIRALTRLVGRFSRLYLEFSIGSLPVIYVLGLIAGSRDVYALAQPGNFNWTRGFITYTACYLCWCVGIIIFSRWYIKKMYGRYTAALQQLLKEIENG